MLLKETNEKDTAYQYSDEMKTIAPSVRLRESLYELPLAMSSRRNSLTGGRYQGTYFASSDLADGSIPDPIYLPCIWPKTDFLDFNSSSSSRMLRVEHGRYSGAHAKM